MRQAVLWITPGLLIRCLNMLPNDYKVVGSVDSKYGDVGLLLESPSIPEGTQELRFFVAYGRDTTIITIKPL